MRRLLHGALEISLSHLRSYEVGRYISYYVPTRGKTRTILSNNILMIILVAPLAVHKPIKFTVRRKLRPTRRRSRSRSQELAVILTV